GALMRAESDPVRLARAVFIGAAYGYLTVSLVDFAEHYRLEHALTGRWTTFRAVPLGESINHAATIAVIVGMLALARPVPAVPTWGDWLWLAAPLVYMALGWRDELVYHR